MKKHGIQIVSNLTGIGIHTIRKWEQRYDVLKPEREPNGRRLYSEGEIEKLQLLHDLTLAGYSISKIAKFNNHQLRSLLKKFDSNPVETEKLDLPKKINILEFKKNFFWALENYRLDIISHELSKLKVLTNEKSLVMDILLPLLKEVGKRTYEGHLSLGNEFALFSILKIHLSQVIFKAYQQKTKKSRVVIFATLENDLYEMDILLGGVLASYYEIKFYYLGTGLPIDALAETCKSLDSNLIIIGLHNLLNKNHDKMRIMYLERLIQKTSINICALGGDQNHYPSLQKEKKFSFVSNIYDLDKFFLTF